MLKKMRNKKSGKTTFIDPSVQARDEVKLDKISAYLISNYGYSEDKVKDMLRVAINGKFDISNQTDRNLMLFTLADILKLEIVNKYNNLFIDLSSGIRGPLVVVTDLSPIIINPTPELSVFFSIEEKNAIDNFNVEAKYVRINFD